MVNEKTAEDLKSLSMAELQAKLGSSLEGLSQAEAQKRLAEYGPNEIEEKKTNPFLKFLTYLWGPIPWMIEAAVVLSAVAQHWPDFAILLLLLLVNAVVGFWEEHQAGNAIAALKATLAIKAQVKRDGKWTTPAARELVPGDIIRLHLGDIVPADARLLEGDPIEVDRSALTGESLPATREPGEAVYSGAIIRQGEIDALVYATGQNTYFGKTAQLVQEAQTVSHFQRAVLKIGNYLIILAVTLGVLILGVIFNTVHEAILILDENMKVLSANRSFFTIFKVNSANTIDSLSYDLGNGQRSIPHLRVMLEDILPKNDTTDDYEIEHNFESIGQKPCFNQCRRKTF